MQQDIIMEFDITQAVTNWLSGQPNYGVVISATNEQIKGREARLTLSLLLHSIILLVLLYNLINFFPVWIQYSLVT